MPAPFTSDLAASLSVDLLDRFSRYVAVETQSAAPRNGSPSTPGQLELGRMLAAELRATGLADAAIDDNGYVFATLPATVEQYADGWGDRPSRHQPRRARCGRAAARPPGL